MVTQIWIKRYLDITAQSLTTTAQMETITINSRCDRMSPTRGQQLHLEGFK